MHLQALRAAATPAAVTTATPASSAPSPAEPAFEQSQAANGPFADMFRLPFTKPHRLYFGPHVQSFPSQAAAIEAARALSAGDAPALVVSSFPATQYDGYKETTRFNVYNVDDVQGPLIENPVVGWKPWNTTWTPYHIGQSAHFSLTTYRPPSGDDKFTGLVLVDGAETEQIKDKRH